MGCLNNMNLNDYLHLNSEIFLPKEEKILQKTGNDFFIV